MIQQGFRACNILKSYNRFAIYPYNLVAGAQAYFFSDRARYYAVLYVAHGDVSLTIFYGEHPENKYADKDIYRNTAEHNNKALPCRFRAKFPRLRRASQLLGIPRFVDHSGNFY